MAVLFCNLFELDYGEIFQNLVLRIGGKLGSCQLDPPIRPCTKTEVGKKIRKILQHLGLPANQLVAGGWGDF